jgi:hypothetical protein
MPALVVVACVAMPAGAQDTMPFHEQQAEYLDGRFSKQADGNIVWTVIAAILVFLMPAFLALALLFVARWWAMSKSATVPSRYAISPTSVGESEEV